MTMFPADGQKYQLRKKDSLGGCYIYSRGGDSLFEGDGDQYEQECFMRLGGGLDLMADDQDESRTEISSNNNQDNEGSSSKDNNNYKDEDGAGAGWLQLSLGSGGQQQRQISRLIELDLLSGSSSGTGTGTGGESSSSQQQQLMMMTPLTLTSPPPPPLIQQQHLSFQVPDFGGPFLTAAAAASTSTSSLYRSGDSSSAAMSFIHHLPFRPNYQPLTSSTTLLVNNPLSNSSEHFQMMMMMRSNEAATATATAGRMDMRVVDPPPRPHSGLWFMLQPSLNQTKEPYLPQLPKSYLRIRDGRTSTVGLLIKYLVNKLKLDSEFQIEITCKGQQLLPFMTLHHVRDNIWRNPRNDAVFSRTSANIDDHLMVLKYGRIA